MGPAVLPELVDTGNAGWYDVRHLCQERLLIDCAVSPSIELRITTEQQYRHYHDASPIMRDQRLPRLRT